MKLGSGYTMSTGSATIHSLFKLNLDDFNRKEVFPWVMICFQTPVHNTYKCLFRSPDNHLEIDVICLLMAGQLLHQIGHPWSELLTFTWVPYNGILLKMDQGISSIPTRTSTSRGTCQVYHVASFLSLKQWYSCIPERGPVNAFSTEFWKAYGNLFDSLTEDGYDVRAVVLSSTFPKIFTAGLDREWSYTLSPGHFYPDYHTVNEASVLGSNSTDSSRDNARASLQTRKTLLAFQHAIGAPERAPFPVIAAVHGHVIGLGVDLISACDIRYAASNSIFSVKVGAPVFPCYFHAPKLLGFLLLLWIPQEVDIGLAPDIGSLSYLPKTTGNQSLVRELTYTARPFLASEAEKLGLVSKVVQGGRDEVVKSALELAKLIATKSPIAVSSSKHLLTHSRDHRWEISFHGSSFISALLLPVFFFFEKRHALCTWIDYSPIPFLQVFLKILLTLAHGTLQLWWLTWVQTYYHTSCPIGKVAADLSL